MTLTTAPCHGGRWQAELPGRKRSLRARARTLRLGGVSKSSRVMPPGPDSPAVAVEVFSSHGASNRSPLERGRCPASRMSALPSLNLVADSPPSPAAIAPPKAALPTKRSILEIFQTTRRLSCPRPKSETENISQIRFLSSWASTHVAPIRF